MGRERLVAALAPRGDVPHWRDQDRRHTLLTRIHHRFLLRLVGCERDLVPDNALAASQPAI
jgi:hypothetical protein